MKHLAEVPVIPRALQLGELSNKPVRKRVPGLLNMTGNVLISAYQKAGKTSLILDLMTGMTQSGTFLGDLNCARLEGSCVYINMELEQNMLRKYCETLGMSLDNPNALFLDYRGLASEFLLGDDLWCDDFIDMLEDHEAKALILDPIHPLVAMSGSSSDDNDESRNVMEKLGRIGRYAKLDHLFVIDHTGHGDKTRARGASSKGDWADIIWNVQSGGTGPDDSRVRTLSALGRDVNHSQMYELDDHGQLSTKITQAPPTIGNAAQPNKLRVLSVLRNSDKPMTMEAIAAESGVDTKQVNNILLAFQLGEVRKLAVKAGRKELWEADSPGY